MYILPQEVKSMLKSGTRSEKYALELFDGRDMMIRSKETASKPCDKMSSHHGLENQKHQVPMLLNSSSKNLQKRKCKQCIHDDKFVTDSDLIDKKKYGTNNAKDQKRKLSHVLCSTPSDEKMTSLPRRQKYGSPIHNDRVEFCVISRQDYSHLSDAEDSVKRISSPENEERCYVHARDLMNNNSYSYGIATSIKEKLKEEDMGFADSRKNFLSFRGNHLPRPFIPIGPRFQAEVPEWEVKTNINRYNSDDCLKWLGTQIWPIPSLSRNNA
ncbi:uncharacterized protein LOC131595655 [Vicia villosa]|uniref:uncharacterized protein LOC131595655 n=1 Tax=Vicia villosa TaxID=3911 RepID=UPI00273BFD09|nr:uncharacterized protein LOC131595655 [Vicia villosa]